MTEAEEQLLARFLPRDPEVEELEVLARRQVRDLLHGRRRRGEPRGWAELLPPPPTRPHRRE